MATAFTQLPGTLDITFVQGDEVAIALDFDRDLTGYTIINVVYVTQSFISEGGGAGFVTGVGETAATFAVSEDNLAEGQITIGLSEAQTEMLTPAVAYRWYLRWIDTGMVTRTVLSGTLTVVNP
jgi:hypothetical protein